MKDSFIHKLRFTFNSGKNPKWRYYVAGYIRVFWPRLFLRRQLKSKLASAASRPDFQEMEARRDYYCRLSGHAASGQDAVRIRDIRIKGRKVYFLDTLRYARFFDKDLKLDLLPGDITFVPPFPAIVKSRPIGGDNRNAVLMKLDRVRHFIFVNDKFSYEEKRDMILFRGKVAAKKQRMAFMERWFGDEMVDAGDVSRRSAGPEEWLRPKLTLAEQLEYKFIMAIEGNDVASNLKWIMSSNSIAVMPRPTFETWFMEGCLVPDYHYIEVKPDFSDLKEKVEHYLANPDRTRAIIRNAHEYVDQFRDKKREDLISLMTLDKYLRLTN